MSQMNRNVNYLTTVDGITVWERLRVIRGFLKDRELAMEIGNLGLEQLKVKQELLEANKSNYTLDNTDEFYKIKEGLLFEEQSLSNLDDAKNEIEFLKELESKLAKEAEKTRIPSKSDKEMYEINYFEELIQKHLLEVQSQLMSQGNITPELMRTLILNKSSLDRAIEVKLLDESISEKLKSNTALDKINSKTRTKLLE